jgi:hypothetical protein
MFKQRLPLPQISRLSPILIVWLTLAWSDGARAEIYKFVDDNGHVTYTNMPRKGAKKLQLETPTAGKPTTPEAKSDRKRTSTPASFPRVDVGTQRKRDDMRQQLLMQELDSEQRNLSAARAAFGASRGQSGSDVERLMNSVRLHEKNIEMLNKELGHLR